MTYNRQRTFINAAEPWQHGGKEPLILVFGIVFWGVARRFALYGMNRSASGHLRAFSRYSFRRFMSGCRVISKSVFTEAPLLPGIMNSDTHNNI